MTPGLLYRWLLYGSLALVTPQSRTSAEWATRRSPAENLIVMVGTADGCRGGGIIVGYDASRLHVITAYHVVREISDEQLTVSVSLTDSRTGAPGPKKSVHALRGPSDAARDLAMVTASEPEVLEALKERTRFDVAGDPGGLVRGDSVYGVGCGDSEPWDRPATLDAVLELTSDHESIAVQSTYLRGGFSGGPLLHVFGSSSFVVGMTITGAPRARAVRLDVIREQLRAWSVPLKLIPSGTTEGCSYSLSKRSLMLASIKNIPDTLSVTTQPNCSWMGYVDGSAWFAPSLSTNPYAPHRGNDILTITAVTDNPCDSRVRRGSMLVAGQLISIEQDFNGKATNVGCN